MKGRWLYFLIKQKLAGEISSVDSWRFIPARFRRKLISLDFQNIKFENLYHTLWSLIAEIFINKKYTLLNMEIEKDDIVFDFGAHKGVFTSYASLRTKNLVYAFEPDPNNYLALVRHIIINQFHNVITHNIGIAGKKGLIPLYQASNSSRNTLSGIDQRTGDNLTKSIMVNVITLTDALSFVNHVDFLKNGL